MSTWLTSIVINSARRSYVDVRFESRSAWTKHFESRIFLWQISFRILDRVLNTSTRAENAAALAYATSRLSPALRMTFQLRDLDGLSIRETAHRMGVPSGTVKARLARARARLKKAINQNTGASVAGIR